MSCFTKRSESKNKKKIFVLSLFTNSKNQHIPHVTLHECLDVKLFAHCSLLVTFCSLLVTFCSLLVTFCLLLVTFCSLLDKKFLKIASLKTSCSEKSDRSSRSQLLRPVTLLKRDSNIGVFLWILRNFSEQLFWRASVNDCFWLQAGELHRNWAAEIYCF